MAKKLLYLKIASYWLTNSGSCFVFSIARDVLIQVDDRSTSVNKIVDRVLDQLGKDINLGAPLGLGKPVHVLNAFYRRARENSEINLTIVTALSLLKPDPESELEKRLVQPLSDRIFGDYPRIDYAHDRRNDQIPPNITVKEFYMNPGSLVDNSYAQQNYISTNYTHAVRDAVEQDINVIAQLVTPARELEERSDPVHSLSCNPDLTYDMMDLMNDRYERDEYVLLGETNANLPFMYGDALIEADNFDFLYEPDKDHTLFGPPSEPVTETDFAIGFHASRLVRDGGTLQIGIGSLSDALTWMLIQRHIDNEGYHRLIDLFDSTSEEEHELVDDIGGEDVFDEGLFAATEMLVRGFEELYRHGLLEREVFNNYEIQRYVNENDGDTSITLDLLDRLVEKNVIEEVLTSDCVDFLRYFGILRNEVTVEGNKLVLPGGEPVRPDLSDPDAREKIERDLLGDTLKHGILAHSCFFLGPPSMYQFLRDLDDKERRRLRMCRISFVNHLYGDEDLKRVQRKDARFLNIAMKVTLSGGVVSDGLEDMRVVSGVGGQYNFVSMAQELADGRSIIMLPSTREKHGKVESNIVWNYGHTTIPRHLRDIVVTEYGIADLRGKSDQEVIKALLRITDARFQDQLAEKAKEAGKIPSDWEIPELYRRNTPEKISEWKQRADDAVDLPEFPFGSELTDEELILARSLRKLNDKVESKRFQLSDLSALGKLFSSPDSAKPYLKRMGLESTDSWNEYLNQKALLLALALNDVI